MRNCWREDPEGDNDWTVKKKKMIKDERKKKKNFQIMVPKYSKPQERRKLTSYFL